MTADYARFDAMLHEQLEGLARRAERVGSYSVEPEPEPEPVTGSLEDLWQLVELARVEDETAVEFAPSEGEGLLASARRECAQFLRATLEKVTSAASVRSEAGVHTRIGWAGDATTLVRHGLSEAEVDRHLTAVQASVTRSGERLRVLTAIVTAAGRIAAIIATPTAAVTALPVAYRCVKDVWNKWRASQSEATPGGTPWQ